MTAASSTAGAIMATRLRSTRRERLWGRQDRNNCRTTVAAALKIATTAR
jgi:hypothetical protein